MEGSFFFLSHPTPSEAAKPPIALNSFHGILCTSQVKPGGRGRGRGRGRAGGQGGIGRGRAGAGAGAGAGAEGQDTGGGPKWATRLKGGGV